MTQSYDRNFSLPTANKPHYCCKVKCHRSLPLNHPTSYTNGLCERHFFLIDLPSNDNDDDNVNNYITNKSDQIQIQQTKKQYEPLRGDIRITREIFDGRQWYIFDETIDEKTSTININNSPLIAMKDKHETLSQIARLLSCYKTIIDEFKEKESN